MVKKNSTLAGALGVKVDPKNKNNSHAMLIKCNSQYDPPYRGFLLNASYRIISCKGTIRHFNLR